MSDPLISLSLGLGDILPTIDPPVNDGPSNTGTPDPTVTVTVTVPNTSSSSSSSSSLISSSSTHSHSGVSTNNATLPLMTPSTLATTNTADFITTTYLTYQGTALVTITALVQNPARMQDNVGTNTFFSNRTAVIGVFTAVGIIIFAAVVALLAWAARKRKLKRLRREAAEKASSSGHRNFFDDEINDVVAPSEKSWWGNTSGTSIPDPTLPMLHVNTGYNNVPAVPPLPGDLSATSPLSDIPTSIAHPYASAPPSVISDSYQVGGVTHTRDNSTITATTTTTTPSRDFSRSPPPSVPLPGVPNRFGQNGGHLPQIDEAPSSSNAWVSANVPASQSHSSKGGPVHPYASPPTNRKSTLYPEDVLFSLGKEGGVGRSLSGRVLAGADRGTPVMMQPQESMLGITQMMHPNNMPQPATSIPPVPQVQVQRPEEPISRNPEVQATRGYQNSQARTAPVHEHHNEYGVNDRSRSLDGRPVSGISDGGWYEHEVSEIGRAAAAASGESVLGGSAAHNTDYGYPRINSASDVNISSVGGEGTQGSHRGAASSPSGTDVRDPKKGLHDPRFSGLFGGSGWISSGDESHRLGSGSNNHGTRLSSARGSFDHGTADDHYYDSGRYGSNGNRVLRVTNE
ncbi:hypothetical protein CPB86DRAFT_821744 [Serendipita vermifera]|nr:hypothetical protein CPB86DRAFT_821744 [Serendipita vermifera]